MNNPMRNWCGPWRVTLDTGRVQSLRTRKLARLWLRLMLRYGHGASGRITRET